MRDRIGFLHRSIGEAWPDTSDEALLARLDDWFVPFQETTRGIDDISSGSLQEGLLALVPYEVQRDLARLAPTHFRGADRPAPSDPL